MWRRGLCGGNGGGSLRGWLGRGLRGGWGFRGEGGKGGGEVLRMGYSMMDLSSHCRK